MYKNCYLNERGESKIAIVEGHFTFYSVWEDVVEELFYKREV